MSKAEEFIVKIVYKPLSKEEQDKFDKSQKEFYEKYIKVQKGEIDMAQNLFDNAKFGDMFLTAENKQAVFLRFANNSEQKFAILYIEGWGNVQVFRHNGKEVHGDAVYSIIKKQQEPVSEELEEEYHRFLREEWFNKPGKTISEMMFLIAKHFAQWQKEQFEKNRLHHCNELTEEQAQIESSFVVQHLKKYNRTPTFIDAIEYGMRLQREDMMKDAIDTTIKQGSTDLGILIKGLDKEKFSFGDKVKVIVIKED